MPASNSALTQFYNCRLIRNNKIIKDDLWVRNGNIVNPEPIFFEEKVSPDVKIDCHGCLIAPGYIDIQINGGFGEDFSNSTVDSIGPAVDKVAKNLLKHGVTSFCPTVITSPSQVYKNLIPRIPKRKGSMNGAEVLGIHIEGPFLSIEKRGAHPMNLIRAIENGFEDVQDMYGSLDNIILLTMAPEVDKTGTVIRKLVDRGIKVSVGHSTCHLQEGEVAVKNGASLITHLFNAMLPFHHRDPGLVGLLTSDAIPEGKTVYYGIIADGIHTHPAALRIAHRTHPSGLVLITDAISAMGLPAGTHHIGQQRIEVQGNKALIAGTDTLCGSIAVLDDCVRNFRKATGCSIVEAIECATLHPAEGLGLSNRIGTLYFDTTADFVLLDDNLNVISTYINGECVWKVEK